MATENKTDLAPFARWPVLGIASAAMAVLLAFSGRYGYHGDELYFVAAGHHLDWGYADQPPLVPLIALLMDTIFPNSVIGLRLPPILLTGTGIVLSALIARELGGRRWPQVVTAGAYACSPFLLAGAGHILATHTVDAFMWTLTSWLVVRWVRTRQDRLLLLAALSTAVAMQVKFLLPVFWIMVAITALIFGPRDLLRRPLLWIGAVLAVATTVPTLLWQVNNGWPQAEMNRIVAGEVAFAGGRYTFLPMALQQAGLIVGAALLLYGVWRLLRSVELRAYRFLGWTTLGVTAVFLATAGRPYYVGGLFAVCWAAGAVELHRQVPARLLRRLRWPVLVPAFAVSAAMAISGLPVIPATSYAGEPYSPMNMALEEFGWPLIVDDVAAAYLALPPGQRERTTIVTENYWLAAAIDQYGPAHGLPEPYSGSRGYWYFGKPPESSTATLYVGSEKQRLQRFFTSVEQVSKLDNGKAVNNQNQGKAIWLATGRKAPWGQLWPQLKHMTFGA